MLYYSKIGRKKVVHLEGCRHISNISEENRGSFININDATKAGYRLCRCCNPCVKLHKHYEKELVWRVYENAFSISFDVNNIIIQAPCSKWKIVATDNGGLALYHKNDIKKPTDADSLIAGYHFQRPVDIPLEELLQYITEHDNYRVRNPIYTVPDKEPPKKGTHRWDREQKKLKKKKRRNAIAVVYSLFDRLESASPAI